MKMSFCRAPIRFSRSHRLALLVLLSMAPGINYAQVPIDNMIFTVGTTAHDSLGRDWSYVLIGSPQPELLGGKKFALYSKPGYSSNSGTYTLRGNIFKQTDTAAINNLVIGLALHCVIENLAQARRQWAAHPDDALGLLLRGTA